MVTERVRVRAHSTHHTQATYPRAKRRTAVLSSRYHAFFAHSDLPLLHHRCLREGWQSLPHSLGDSLAPRPPLPVRGHSHCRHRLGVQGGALTCSRVSAHKGSPVSARQLRRYVACVCGWLGACACACVCACVRAYVCVRARAPPCEHVEAYFAPTLWISVVTLAHSTLTAYSDTHSLTHSHSLYTAGCSRGAVYSSHWSRARRRLFRQTPQTY